jgi:hypothetical protein
MRSRHVALLSETLSYHGNVISHASQLLCGKQNNEALIEQFTLTATTGTTK